jgi:hypothetical protein
MPWTENTFWPVRNNPLLSEHQIICVQARKKQPKKNLEFGQALRFSDKLNISVLGSLGEGKIIVSGRSLDGATLGKDS